jgi:hypothetical protein
VGHVTRAAHTPDGRTATPRRARRRSAVWALALAGVTLAGVARGRALLALSEVTMADGEVVECVVPISRELTFDDAATDGFYLVGAASDGQQDVRPYLFSADLAWLEPHSGRGHLTSTGPFGDAPARHSLRAYYLRDITGRFGPPREESERVRTGHGRDVLLREKVYRARHAMLDYVPVYADVLSALQGACFPPTEGAVPEEMRVPLARVEWFALVRQPSAERLARVQAGLAAWAASVTLDPIDEDVPVWYHDVVARPPRADWVFRTWGMAP